MKRFYQLAQLAACYSLICFSISSCTDIAPKNGRADSLAIRKKVPDAPVLTARAAIAKMHVEDGFAVRLVAEEPLVSAPVALSFDEKGRIWVVEMQDYMPDTVGTGEDKPGGKIVILSDTNRDGLMDTRQVFLDSLVLPRAICLIDDGILVAEPPRLWYYTIKNDKAAGRTLVDSAYAVGGNVEHQPNGLFRAVDNWIYNAKSSKRYKKAGNRWLIEKTHFRGQWGISQDDYGRLYYNTNSDNLIGDYFMPGPGAENDHQRDVAGFGETIVEDNRVYPVRPTPGVNRGYMPGILDDSLRLVNFTAACGPLIYNGHLFGKDYEGNAFVAEPSANLIKRDLLAEDGYRTTGKEAYAKKEFLASEDERFRPVNLHIGPDGAIYIVDMYRGIIQHKTYLTPYLKHEIKERSLTDPLNFGRIYKIVPVAQAAGNDSGKNANPGPIPFGGSPGEWVALLRHPNGWVRSRAQQLLVDAKDPKTVPALRQLLKDPAGPIPMIHALWTLEGMGALQGPDLLPLLKAHEWPLRMEALNLLPSVMDKKNYQAFIPALTAMLQGKDSLAAPYIAFLARTVRSFDPVLAHNWLIGLAREYPDNSYVDDAVISSLYKQEAAFYKEALAIHPDTGLVFNRHLRKLIDDMTKDKSAGDFKALAKAYPKGTAIFQSVCQTCHGAAGNGVVGLGPPLNSSNWVQGNKSRLIPIVLYGLTGPVKVSGKWYKPPETSGDMPGIGTNKEFTDEDIAQVLSLIRNAWNNKAGKIIPEDIGEMRGKYKDRQKTFTMEELEQLK